MRVLMGSGEDPDETFRGEIQANQDLVDYGIHARGILRLIGLLKNAGRLPALLEARLLYDLESIRGALAQGQPVVAWVSEWDDWSPRGAAQVASTLARFKERLRALPPPRDRWERLAARVMDDYIDLELDQLDQADPLTDLNSIASPLQTVCES